MDHYLGPVGSLLGSLGDDGVHQPIAQPGGCNRTVNRLTAALAQAELEASA